MEGNIKRGGVKTVELTQWGGVITEMGGVISNMGGVKKEWEVKVGIGKH